MNAILPDAGARGGYVFRLPDLGEGAVEAEIVAWHVEPGAQVEEDQLLLEVMTDKATMEITSPVSGRLVSRHGEPGQSMPVGCDLAVFETAVLETGAAPALSPTAQVESDNSATDKARQDGETGFYGVTPDLENDAAPEPAAPEPPAREKDGHAGAAPLAAPAVRRRAAELGLDLSRMQGGGPQGRITHQDLDAAVAARSGSGAATPTVAPADEQVKVIGLRRRIAEKMQQSKRRIPHFAYVEEVDVTELEALRAHLNARWANARPKLTVLPFLIRAIVRAVAAHPQVNATYDDEAGVLTRHGAVHLGLATQTPGGLMVPVIRDAQALDLWGLAAEIVRVAGHARDGTAAREALSGSTLTVTSLGPLGGVAHTPVINAPEVAIVGPNRIVERPVVREGQIVVRKMMNLSSSFDHRIVDGHDAASFIQTVKGLLEYPATLFID